MPCPGEGPCDSWDLDLRCLDDDGSVSDPCLGDGTPVPQEIVDAMILAASQFMWAATGRQFGTCTATIRPCRKDCNESCCISPETGFPWTPVHLTDGSWTNISCDCDDGCSCVSRCSINLPYPVCSIYEVVIDGEALDPSMYRVENHRKLVRLALGSEGKSNTKYVYGPSNTSLTADGGTFTLEFLEAGSTDPIPWNASEEDIQAILDSLLGEGVVKASLWLPNQPLNGGLTIELVGPYAGVDVPGYLIGADSSSVTGPDAPYTYPFNQLVEGGLDLIGPEPGACWPKCNDLSKPNGEVGTWSVTLTYGKEIPELVRLAAAELACQLIKKASGRPCDLPQRIQSINRQGMSATFLDPMEFMSEGMTGIFLVDLAIKTYNPHRLFKKPSVVSPDSLNRWSVTTDGD